MRMPIRAVKFWWQRRTRGWDDRETWDLDITLARWIAPRLEALRDGTHSFPYSVTEEEWFAIQDKMAQAFRLIIKDEWWAMQSEYVAEGLDLFREYFFDLWD